MVATGRIVTLDLTAAGREGPSGRDEMDDIKTTRALMFTSPDRAHNALRVARV
jgi:hypothetical protein